MTLTRRDLLKIGAVGGAAAVLPLERLGFAAGSTARMPTSSLPAKFSLPFRRPLELASAGTVGVTCPDGVVRSYPSYSLTQRFTVAEILPGYKTPVFGYDGMVPGPTLRMRRGQPAVVRQANQLQRPPEPPYEDSPMPSRYTSDPWRRSTSTHLHGSATLPQYDGYASDLTYPGQAKSYVYPNSQEARTLWYHDHAVHHTAQNAYNGLAGMYILHDEVEAGLGIPSGLNPEQLAYDVPLVVRDAMFATDGGLIYDDDDESGVFGDVPLVNGVPWPRMQVEPRWYRFRLLNASATRSYEWRVHDGRSNIPLIMVGTDGGLMPVPKTVSKFRQAAAERYEFMIDFSKYKGATLTLRNDNPKNNRSFSGVTQVMQFRVSRESPTNLSGNVAPGNWADRVHAECMSWSEPNLLAQGVPVRRFRFNRSGGQWTINGETWDDVIDSGYRHCQAEPELDAIEIWDLANESGGWQHPVHVHLVDFQVLSRTKDGRPAKVFDFERGPKDTAYVGENETVRVAMRFNGPAAGPGWPAPRGRYMMHCHNLVHEDHDMMMQFSVGDPDYDAEIDPISADPARADV